MRWQGNWSYLLDLANVSIKEINSIVYCPQRCKAKERYISTSIFIQYIIGVVSQQKQNNLAFAPVIVKAFGLSYSSEKGSIVVSSHLKGTRFAEQIIYPDQIQWGLIRAWTRTPSYGSIY